MAAGYKNFGGGVTPFNSVDGLKVFSIRFCGDGAGIHDEKSGVLRMGVCDRIDFFELTRHPIGFILVYLATKG